MSVVAREKDFFQFFLIEDSDAFLLRVPTDNFGMFFRLSDLLFTLSMLQSFPIKEAGFSYEVGIFEISKRRRIIISNLAHKSFLTSTSKGRKLGKRLKIKMVIE